MLMFGMCGAAMMNFHEYRQAVIRKSPGVGSVVINAYV